MSETAGRVLVVDGNQAIADLVQEILADDGYTVTTLADHGPGALQAVVAQLEPDCVLLDGAGPRGYGRSWQDAAWLARRERPVPVVMFSADTEAIQEAQEHTSRQSQAAGFAAAIGKPFGLQDLVRTVARVIKRSPD